MKAAADISVGRQLFVDDFLVESSRGVSRHWNKPVKMDAPVLWPGIPGATPKTAKFASPGDPVNLVCATDGGLWWDPSRRRFRLWYQADWLGDLCYAESIDGLSWTFPDLGAVPGTNRVFARNALDSWCVVPNYAAADPYSDWKLYISPPANNGDYHPWLDGCDYFIESPAEARGGSPPWLGDCIWSSADGMRFSLLGIAGRSGDRSTMYYDPFRREWVFSLRDARAGLGRIRRRFTSREFGGEECRWSWPAGTDPESHRGRRVPEEWLESANRGSRQLYSFDAVAYESVMLGVMEMLSETPNGNRDCEDVGLPKRTALHFCFSRDGRTFEPRDLPDIEPEGWGSGRWDTGYLSPTGGICAINGERLWFYYSGLRGNACRTGTGRDWWRNGMYSNGAIGVATLRRDGFAGMVADGDGEIATVPVVFDGNRLFVNAECRFGSLRAEILDGDGKAIPGFSRDDCAAFSGGDSTKFELAFRGGDLSALSGRQVQFRFPMHCATLFSFWVSPSARGESRGYLAAGGPGYPGLRDL